MIDAVVFFTSGVGLAISLFSLIVELNASRIALYQRLVRAISAAFLCGILGFLAAPAFMTAKAFQLTLASRLWFWVLAGFLFVVALALYRVHSRLRNVIRDHQLLHRIENDLKLVRELRERDDELS